MLNLKGGRQTYLVHFTFLKDTGCTYKQSKYSTWGQQLGKLNKTLNFIVKFSSSPWAYHFVLFQGVILMTFMPLKYVAVLFNSK